LLYDEVKNELYFQASTNLDAPIMGRLTVPVDGSIAGSIVTSREAVIVQETHKDPRHFDQIEDMTDFRVDSLLGVPLISNEKVIGVLEAINKKKSSFTAEDQALLSALGAQAAVAIENARLFQQSDLVAEMVHELRTPLASISTASSLLTRPEISEVQRAKIAKTIQMEAERLSELATTFLDLARLESGRSQFRIEDIDLAALLRDSAEIMQGRIIENGLELKLDFEEDLPTLQGDRDSLKQVILNLLSNAIKYNLPNGKITIRAWTEDDHLCFSVADTGRGIMKEHMGGLFQKFYRAPGAEQIAPGTGLGLSICKKIIDAHRGTIEVESKKGAGATFTIRLPA
jgi:signal transduction histidine kinase